MVHDPVGLLTREVAIVDCKYTGTLEEGTVGAAIAADVVYDAAG